jgi:HEAT repeat protein
MIRTSIAFVFLTLIITSVPAYAKEFSLANAEIQTLIEQLDSHDKDIRIEAIAALGKIGPDAEAAAPFIIDFLDDVDDYTRQAAVRALIRINADISNATPKLFEMWRDKDEDYNTRVLALKALITFGWKSDVVRGFIEALSDTDPFIRQDAAMALGGLGHDAEVAIPFLIEMLRDAVEWLRPAAAQALGGIGLDKYGAVTALTRALMEDDTWLQECAANALGRIGPDASAALGELWAILIIDYDEFVSRAAYNAIAKIEGSRPNIDYKYTKPGSLPDIPVDHW